MVLREMLEFPKGPLLLLLTCLGGLVLGEVGEFSTCPQFFYKSTPPKGLNTTRYQPICQRYKNQYRFASLYDRLHRTSLYSAYLLTHPDGKRPTNKWMFEPQLAYSHASPEMQRFPRHGPVSQNVIESQAVLQDYTNSTYTKGHLNPSLHHQNKDERRATFTLTNIVPQRLGSNSGPWAVLESDVSTRLATFCTGPAYVITGTLPYLSGERWIKNRVAVPEYLWSAYCCPTYNASRPESLRLYFPSYAAVGRNDRDSGEEIVPVDPKAKASVRGYDVRRMSLETLEEILLKRQAVAVSLFHGQCHQHGGYSG